MMTRIKSFVDKSVASHVHNKIMMITARNKTFHLLYVRISTHCFARRKRITTTKPERKREGEREGGSKEEKT